MNAILIIDKPQGMTSYDALCKLKHILKVKKLGHTGTLDPIATGVLVVTIDKYTRLNELLTSTYKEYIAEFKLGILTDTLDITGEVLKEEKVNIPEDKIKDIVHKFKGKYNQEVPIYSSVKVKGKKLYEYARSNTEVELPKKEVHIKTIKVIDINEEGIVKIRCLVSKGTYIRSLIRDIGIKLGTCATMTSLRRTKQGDFNIEDAYTLKDVKFGEYKLLDIEDVLDVEIRNIEEDEDKELLKKVSNGVKLNIICPKDYILYKYNGENFALYKSDNIDYKMFIKY